MPIYEYLCEKCKHEFEAEQRITDAPIRTCPKCRARKVKRLISQTSFVLKGGGWYSDLYSSKSTAKDSAKDTGKESAAEAKPAASSETAAPAAGDKPAPKSDSGGTSKKGKKGGRAAA
jgi:putative FmdB family regulatory protein